MRDNSVINSAPFSAEILKKATKIAKSYNILIKQEGASWTGQAVEYPEAIGTGITPDECVQSTREIAASGIALMLEMGETPPLAITSSPGTRTEQANIRMTKAEKIFLESAAKQKGFRGLSDFIRTTALENAR